MLTGTDIAVLASVVTASVLALAIGIFVYVNYRAVKNFFARITSRSLPKFADSASDWRFSTGSERGSSASMLGRGSESHISIAMTPISVGSTQPPPSTSSTPLPRPVAPIPPVVATVKELPMARRSITQSRQSVKRLSDARASMCEVGSLSVSQISQTQSERDSPSIWGSSDSECGSIRASEMNNSMFARPSERERSHSPSIITMSSIHEMDIGSDITPSIKMDTDKLLPSSTDASEMVKALETANSSPSTHTKKDTSPLNSPGTHDITVSPSESKTWKEVDSPAAALSSQLPSSATTPQHVHGGDEGIAISKNLAAGTSSPDANEDNIGDLWKNVESPPRPTSINSNSESTIVAAPQDNLEEKDAELSAHVNSKIRTDNSSSIGSTTSRGKRDSVTRELQLESKALGAKPIVTILPSKRNSTIPKKQ